MYNKFCKKHLWECTEQLVAVALGKEKADLVITNAKLVNVCTHEIQENISVAVSCGRIAKVGDCTDQIGEKTKVYDAKGRYLAPSFLDGHMHFESTMIRPSEYAKIAIIHGTSGVFYDPHEVANVAGLKAVKCMMKDAETSPLKSYLTTPSCVPAVDGFEDTGSKIDDKDIAESMKWDSTVALGEMMNFPGILNCWEKPHKEVQETLKADKVVCGHYSIQETGAGLNAYIASGIRCCHESVREIDVIAKMRLGMYAQLREGSAWRDLKEVTKAITQHKVDSRFATLISDDRHIDTLVDDGHMDDIVKIAIQCGVDPLTAIQMATINTAECYMLAHEIGSITPSKCADMVIFEDLNKINVKATFIDGELVAENGNFLGKIKKYEFPEYLKNTMHIATLTENDFKVPATGDKANVNVIEITEGCTITHIKKMNMKVEDGELKTDVKRDIAKIAVFERHHNSGSKSIAFVTGFKLKTGAIAQTYAHDAHNLIVVGTNDLDMKVAANALKDCGGGMVVVINGAIEKILPYRICGLMTEMPYEQFYHEMADFVDRIKKTGCKMDSPQMTLSALSLACIPEIRLTNKGLVDCVNFKFVDLINK